MILPVLTASTTLSAMAASSPSSLFTLITKHISCSSFYVCLHYIFVRYNLPYMLAVKYEIAHILFSDLSQITLITLDNLFYTATKAMAPPGGHSVIIPRRYIFTKYCNAPVITLVVKDRSKTGVRCAISRTHGLTPFRTFR
ncbi:hypothetical protein Desgi_2784 [Desulfoscipio gibsoniae DSM 7213]|uniref:Secreted protein n=1 Tax=Desulfoscipio gibsoniae DSM 7213 TaxID=767817 RepID=R4KNQ8_9FIRM|nr:hypothetical protein Desgi_2784 [Desulfoscipio gibsoniae DSM 7213]